MGQMYHQHRLLVILQGKVLEVLHGTEIGRASCRERV